jgi:hypothetical protein
MVLLFLDRLKEIAGDAIAARGAANDETTDLVSIN